MEKLTNWILTIGTFFGLLFLGGVFFALPTMLLWNWLMPTIFGVCEVTIWQALGINLLAGILFDRKATVTKE